ncbi:MAG: DNA polymerase III subunit gamma/tau [Oscillospiraceae bacterium]|nr:DNA polymerase III subunit gamma/tau [Oscillospiraceae bacterium]
MYQALYRKWRPRTFDDVVGQEHITQTLKNEVAAGRPSHAYLFCGTRGTGKTTCSKILAKAVNCPNQKDGNPCCACDICRGVEDGSILDITEIDAASNSGVDNIRDLREEAFYTPTVCRYRVYIIDETHMLSTGAFNALLKIMEEPPAHVLFILATTEIHKVPATILSRCQRFDFRRIASGVIADRLLTIAEDEDFTLSADAADLIARLSDGGMRDAISLLDLCVSSDAHVTAETVRERAGLVDQSYLFDIARAVSGADSGAVFSVMADLWARSVDYQRLCEQLIGFYRNLMVAKSVSDPDDLIACLPEELEQYKIMAKDTPMPDIMRCLDILQDALVRMSRVSARRAELEMALLKLAAPARRPDVEDDLLARVEKLETAVKSGVMSRAPETDARAKAAPDPMPDSEEIQKTKVALFERWDDVLGILMEKNKALHGALVGSKAYTGGDLFLVDAGPLFASLVRTDGYAKESLRDALIAVTGRKYRLGPYNAKKYEVDSPANSQLDDILSKAGAMGADIQVR